MGIKSKFITGILYTDIIDDFSFSDIVEHINFINGLDEQTENFREFVDHTDCNHVSLSSVEINEGVLLCGKTVRKYKSSYIAFYASHDLPYGISRMFQTFAEIENNPSEVQVFRNRDMALQWLTSR